jgi:two-component system LytT family response regulator
MSAPVRILVVDDEPLARSGMITLLGRDPEVQVIGECGDGAAAAAAITRDHPDLVLLDVQMPEADGFEVLQAVGADRMPVVIFVTAYDQFAVKAFEVHALDYLLKPFDDERFMAAIGRAKRALRQSHPDLADLGRRLAGLLQHTAGSAADRYLSRLIVKETGRAIFLSVDELDWIEAADYYVKLHVAGVNLDRVKEIQPLFKGEHVVILHDGARLKLARNRKESLEALLGQSL